MSVEHATSHEAIGAPDRRIAAGELIPPMTLVSTATGKAVNLRATRGPRALIVMHSVSCRACRGYVREQLAAGARAISEWGGRLTVVVPGPLGVAADFAETTTDALEVLADSEAAFAGCGAAVVIADQWGEVYFAADAGAGHDLPVCEDIVAWVRFLAIQCPECEGPEGEWRAV